MRLLPLGAESSINAPRGLRTAGGVFMRTQGGRLKSIEVGERVKDPGADRWLRTWKEVAALSAAMT